MKILTDDNVVLHIKGGIVMVLITPGQLTGVISWRHQVVSLTLCYHMSPSFMSHDLARSRKV